MNSPKTYAPHLFLCGVLLFCSLFITALQARQLPQSMGQLANWQRTENGLSCQAQLGTGQTQPFSITVYAPHTIRIQVAGPNGTLDHFSYATVAKPQQVNFTVQETQGRIELKTSALHLHIQTNPVRFAFYTPEGQLISQDDPGMGTTTWGNELTAYKTLQKGERFIGLGEKTGNLDRKGQGYVNYNLDNYGYSTGADPLYASIPFYIGVHSGLSYGLFLDNSHRSTFNFGASNRRFSSFGVQGGNLDYYFMYTPTVAGIIEAYTSLTGRMEMPARWGLGFQQCRYTYFPDTRLLDVAQTFRDRQIPADVLYLDIHYMDAYKIFTWNNNKYQSPKAMLQELKDMGFRVVVIVDPGIKIDPAYDAYKEGKEQDLFIKHTDGSLYEGEVWPGWCHFPDFTKPEARLWWGQKFKGYVNDGIEGFWNDMNEISTWGNKLPENIVFDYEGTPSPTRRGRNVYGMEMARSTFEGTRQLMGKRPFILTRAGFAGVQRYSALWTGDNNPTDDHMLLGVRLVNSLGLSGVAYAGPDVGGFTGDPSPGLYARWISVGAFTPFFRSHTAVNTRAAEPWSFGESTEEVARKYIGLRYRLMPYLYSAFYEATQSGLPVARSLAIDYTHDANIYNTAFQNQYLFGPSIMVAPVASYHNLTKVYLPKGQWYDMHNGQPMEGGKVHVVDCPTDRLPLFVKGGGLLLEESQKQHHEAAAKEPGVLYLHVYKGQEGSTLTWYDDDGTTYDYAQKQFALRNIAYNAAENKVTITAPEGQYKSPYSTLKVVMHGFEQAPAQVRANGKRVQVQQQAFRWLTATPERFSAWGADTNPGEEKVGMATMPLNNKALTISW